MLEEMDTLFGGANHVEKGGDLLHVEDARHARHASVGGGEGNTNDVISSYGAVGTQSQGRGDVNEIKE